MGRRSVFWAFVLIVIGCALLLDNFRVLAYLHINLWGLVWPLLLIALGVRMLWRIGRKTSRTEAEQVTIPLATPPATRRRAEAREEVIPLQAATRARICIHHGAGRLQVRAGAPEGQLLSGAFVGGLDYRASLAGDMLDVDMRVPPSMSSLCGPWGWEGPLDWTFALTTEIPLSLDLETGANDTQLDLSDLRVSDLRLKTGASSTALTLPRHAGRTRVAIEAGAASLTIRVPDGVAARIRVEGALSRTGVDAIRFPPADDGYCSVDYDTATDSVDLHIKSAVGSVDVR